MPGLVQTSTYIHVSYLQEPEEVEVMEDQEGSDTPVSFNSQQEMTTAQVSLSC